MSPEVREVVRRLIAAGKTDRSIARTVSLPVDEVARERGQK